MDILTLPVLYSFRRCPYAMRARLALLVSQLPVELREIVLRDKPHSMIEASPKATVPVLVLPDGTVIDESMDIMRYALSLRDPRSWYNECDRAQIDALIALNDGPFKSALDRYKYPDRQSDASTLGQNPRDAAAQIINGYEHRLTQTKAGLTGFQPTLADYAILPFVRQFAHVDTEWFYSQPWPHVIAWLDQFKQSELFADVMEKYEAWQPGDPPVRFAGG